MNRHTPPIVRRTRRGDTVTTRFYLKPDTSVPDGHVVVEEVTLEVLPPGPKLRLESANERGKLWLR